MSQLPANSEFGNYHIIRHIAGGGMAQIYLAKVVGLAGFEKRLALKVINPDYADEQRFIQMLIDEAKITVGLSHVNIGQVFDLGQVNGIYYIAMEFVDGIDVLELVNGLHSLGEKVPCDAVALIGRQICSGLHYAHTKKDPKGIPLNIVHRDISPQNILVSRAGEVKVVDFGIAKAAGVSTKTQAGVIKGKVHYMAPEQAMGKTADRRSDIFSTGIVLWEMLTSQMLYSGDNVRDLVERVRVANITSPAKHRPDVPSGLARIVMKALARRPEDRFPTAHAFQVELTKFLAVNAPDYGASQLAALAEQVIAAKLGAAAYRYQVEQAEHLSKEDMVQDIHSVIANQYGEEPHDQARLIVETSQGKIVRVLSNELVIGRAGQLAIPDARVSRRHACLRLSPNGYTVEDLGSANGTFVNEQKLSGPRLLEDKDTIRIGSFRILFRLPERNPTEHSSPDVVFMLRISCGATFVEHVLDAEFPLTYALQLGPAKLHGLAGRVHRREDGFWLEPAAQPRMVLLNGAKATSPMRLTPGDVFNVGAVRFEFRQSSPS